MAEGAGSEIYHLTYHATYLTSPTSSIMSAQFTRGRAVIAKATMASTSLLLPSRSAQRLLRNQNILIATTAARAFTSSSNSFLPSIGSPSTSSLSSSTGGPLPTYFQKPRLPTNTVVRFVPQQTAWLVERMGKFNRILEPGLAILVPFIDRIAYVKSLKEVALEIPKQSAITADNVTLELDGVLFTRVFDAYKAR